MKKRLLFVTLFATISFPCVNIVTCPWEKWRSANSCTTCSDLPGFSVTIRIKQDHLATELGVSQRTVSKIEQSEEVDETTLSKVARVLGVSPEGIKAFNEESLINNINSSYDNSTFNVNNNCSFNPLDKLMELVEENKNLYERLLAIEREKVEILGRKV